MSLQLHAFTLDVGQILPNLLIFTRLDDTCHDILDDTREDTYHDTHDDTHDTHLFNWLTVV
jgi:hypothetical protein